MLEDFKPKDWERKVDNLRSKWGIDKPEMTQENPVQEQTTQEDPYASRIEALKTLPRSEYDVAIDALISELEEKNLLDQYEAQLTEIDKSRVNELSEMVTKTASK